MLWKRIIVHEWERLLVSRNGRFRAILMPGKHRIFVAPGSSLDIEKHDVRDLVFESAWADYLIAGRPDILARHFTCVETNEVQIGIVYAAGRLVHVLPPAKRVLFWRGQAEITVELVDVIGDPGASSAILEAVEPEDDSFNAWNALEEELET